MLLRFDPFREFDRATEQMLNRTARPSIPMDAVRDGDRVFIYFDIPGLKSDDIDLTVERNTLTLRVERRWEPTESQEILASERPQGSFTRTLLLGDTLDPSKLNAKYDDGVLIVEIPVAEAAQPRKVQVSGGGQSAQSIQAESTEK